MAIPSPLTPSADDLTSWGLDPRWSRRVEFPGADGTPVNWHVLDTGPGLRGTIVCVHGNPTWGYLWRDLLETLSPDWRVIAVDQTGMGYSERGRPRVLAQRIEELVSFCTQEVAGPLVLAAHDWGGPVAIGAAGSLAVDAVVLANTAVAKPADVKVPPLIATARRMVDLMCRRTPLFVDGTGWMTQKRHRAALRAPYRSAERREAVREFVADIPLGPGDVSQQALERCAETFSSLSCPILVLWGGKDPVFHDRFLRDLERRAPQAEIHRYPSAGHLVALDEPIGVTVRHWLDAPPSSARPVADGGEFRSVVDIVDARATDSSPVYIGPDATLGWDELAAASTRSAAVLLDAGLMRGDRVSLLIPPSPELLIAMIGVWKAGGVPVVADDANGILALRRLVRARAPRFVLGTARTLVAARLLRVAPGARFGAFGRIPGALDLTSGPSSCDWQPIAPDEVAAIVHTSGATGPAKAVRYTHGQLMAQRGAVASMFTLAPGTAFTTSFGAFMLLSPLLEMTCVRPDVDVASPADLGFDQLSNAVSAAKVTTAWLSPASARTIVATAENRHMPIDLVLLAGAPVGEELRAAVAEITGGEVRSPYGMTECLPVTDGVRGTRHGKLGGLGVGRPLGGCRIEIEPLSGVAWGEILVAAPWLFDGYEGALGADLAANVIIAGERFHRTGDVGYVDGGELFVLGRRAHVIETAAGPVASVGVEEQIAKVLNRQVAAVGIGPRGAQVVVVVVAGKGKLRLADGVLREQVRMAETQHIAAVLEGELPVDLRHQSKVDRQRLGSAAAALLAGR